MRKFAVLAAPFLLVACTSEPAEEEVVEAPVAVETVAMTTANGSPLGDFSVTGADGNVGTTSLRDDGTYSDTAADGTVIAEGTWAVTDGKMCFSPTTEGVTPMCYAESTPAEDGSFTATPDDGDPVQVRPLAAS